MYKQILMNAFLASALTLVSLSVAHAKEPNLEVSCGDHWLGANIALSSEHEAGMISFDGDSGIDRPDASVTYSVDGETGDILVTILDEIGGAVEMSPVINPHTQTHQGWFARIKLDTNSEWRQFGWCY